MTPEEFKQTMKQIDQGKDPEGEHADADFLMEQLLIKLGYGEGIEIYRKMLKWYA